jgi:hypothetical protein
VAKIRRNTVPPEQIVGVVERLHRAYGFRPECHRFVGVANEVLARAGVLADAKAKKPKRGVRR